MGFNSGFKGLITTNSNQTEIYDLQVSEYQNLKFHVYSRKLSPLHPLPTSRNIISYWLAQIYIPCSCIAGLLPQNPLSRCITTFRASYKPYGPPTSVTWLQLLCKRTNTGTSTALTAETLWSTRTRLSALSHLITSTYAR